MHPPSPLPTLRLLARADFPLLTHWLSQPHVARWWNHETSPAALERDFGPSIDGDDRAEIFIASIDGSQSKRPIASRPDPDLTPDSASAPDREPNRPIGLVQRYTFADNPGYIEELAPLLAVPGEALSMDYFIGEPDALRRGLGSAMLHAALQSTWRDYPNAPSVVVPVSAANTASWRVLERIGFRRVAQGPLTPDNPIDGPEHYVYAIARPLTR